jgi:inward rectifier potassium channel
VRGKWEAIAQVRVAGEVKVKGPGRKAGGGKPQRWDPTDAVRKGGSTNLGRDFYFYLMEGSWLRLILFFAVAFMLANVFFAARYATRPDSIAGTSRGHLFVDAFFFSVQTLTTVGYGALSPATAHGSTVATLEAATGLFGVATFTGLVFTKVSRPKAAVLFSDSVVLTKLGTAQALMFRVGNTRGNDFTSVHLELNVTIDEETPDGHRFRSLRKLELKRDRSPIFALSWMAIHEIDDASPLEYVDWAVPERSLVWFVATLIGHDGTYGQTIQARKMWYPEDVKQNARFVDVLHELPDGRMLVDHEAFHDTRPEEEGGA